jgi:hypothetical protein
VVHYGAHPTGDSLQTESKSLPQLSHRQYHHHNFQIAIAIIPKNERGVTILIIPAIEFLVVFYTK